MVTEEVSPYTVDRPRGILSSSDRKYLIVSEEERLRADDPDKQGPFTRPARRQRENNIVERLYHGVLDFALIAREVDQPTVRIDYEEIFTTDDPTSVPRIRVDTPQILTALVRAITANESDRPITNAGDLRAVAAPAVDGLEKAIENWLNTQRNMTAEYELTLSIENVRSIDSLVEELEIRREPLTGEERVRVGAVLERAGYDDAEITALIGEEPDGDESGSEYPMRQLVEFPIETLTELVAEGKITETEHTTAIRQKAETGDI
jgi:hypothetical protein